jgi:hypothetical protein
MEERWDDSIPELEEEIEFVEAPAYTADLRKRQGTEGEGGPVRTEREERRLQWPWSNLREGKSKKERIAALEAQLKAKEEENERLTKMIQGIFEATQCGICARPMTSQVKGCEPKTLMCGHTLCAYCHQQWHGFRAGGCPICRSDGGLAQTNFTLAAVLSALDEHVDRHV